VIDALCEVSDPQFVKAVIQLSLFYSFMADIVGLVASVLQLVDTVAKARGYIINFRDAPKDQKRLLLEIQNLAPLVKELDKRVKSNRYAGLTSGLQEFGVPLMQLKEVMEGLTKKLNPTNGVSKVIHRMAWSLWEKEDVQETLKTVERFKSLLMTQLGMDIWSVISPSTYIFY
jgi:type II secretory pathway component PulF